MVIQLLVFICIISISTGMYTETPDFCESKAEATVSLDMAIHLLNKVKTYHNKDMAIHLLNKVKTYPNKDMADKSLCSRPVDCEDVLRNGGNKSGTYKVWPRSRIANGSIEVYCDMETDGGGWTVFQRRGDFGRPKDYFYQDWRAYKTGFGNITIDFWLGNDNIFALSNQRSYSLRIDLRDVEGKTAYAIYNSFWIDDEQHQYTLHIAGFSGDAGDSMIGVHNHDGQKFSTKDRKNDNEAGEESCSSKFKGGWWYNRCHGANLNGLYHKGQNATFCDGVLWASFTGFLESLEWTEMKIRRKGFHI